MLKMKLLIFFVLGQATVFGVESSGQTSSATEAERRSKAIAEAKILLTKQLTEDNKAIQALNAARDGNEFLIALDAWADAFVVFNRNMEAVDARAGFKLVTAKEPPAELKPSFSAFEASNTKVTEVMGEKAQLHSSSPEFGSRMNRIVAKLNSIGKVSQDPNECSMKGFNECLAACGGIMKPKCKAACELKIQSCSREELNKKMR